MANFYATYPFEGGGSGGGVTSLNTLTGDVVLAAGTNITLTPVGNTITIASSGSGNVVGPGSATDNAIARFDGTTGQLIQNSNAVLDDAGNVGFQGTLVAAQVIDSGLTANTVPYTNGSLQFTSSAVTPTELGFVSGVTSSIQTQLNGKQATLTIGNLTDAGTDGITVTGGTGSVIGAGTSIAQNVADTTHNGYLSSTDWNTFNGKQAALTLGNLTDVGTDGITVNGGTGAVVGSGTSIAQHVADTTHNGYLSSTDWNTFNGKGSGTVTAVSVVSANGLAGTSSGGATPALTLSTTVTGLVKGNGTTLSAAVSGTDYAPATTGTGYQKGNGTGGFTNQATPIPTADVSTARTINTQTGTTYTFVLADGSQAGGNPLLTASNASAQTYTVPPHSSVAFPVGAQIDLVQLGAGKVTLAQGAGVTINSFSSNKSIGGQYIGVSLFNTATDVWVLLGSLIA